MMKPMLIVVALILFWENGPLQRVEGGFSNCALCLLLCDGDDPMDAPRDDTAMEEQRNMFPGREKRSPLWFQPPLRKYEDYEHCLYTKADVQQLLTSVKRTVNFYSTNTHQLKRRQDGGFGLDILIGQLKHLKKYSKSKLMKRSISEILKSSKKPLKEVARTILELAKDAEKNPAIVHGIEVFLNNSDVLHTDFKKWTSIQDLSALRKQFLEIGNEKEVIYPFLDFQCLVAMVKECRVPFVCEKMYLEQPYSQYMLLHQILLLHFANQKSCTSSNPLLKNREDFVRKLCGKAYLEAEYIASHSFPVRYRDLFAEQVAFCGMAGFNDFMRRDWFHEIMSWESDNQVGCIPDLYGTTRTTDIAIKVPYIGSRGGFGEESCLIHLTSVALGAKAMFLRHMADTCPMDELLG